MFIKRYLSVSLVKQKAQNRRQKLTGAREVYLTRHVDLFFFHSPDATGLLSVHALLAIMDSSNTAPVNSRSRPRAFPETRWTRCSLIIAVAGGREGARTASRLKGRAEERVSLPPLYHPLSFPATRRRLRATGSFRATLVSQPSPFPLPPPKAPS